MGACIQPWSKHWTESASKHTKIGMDLDEQLYARLNEQDWETIVGKLTLAAKRQLVLCGMPRNADSGQYCPSGTNPEEYALDAMVKVFEGCSTGENKWNPIRGDLYPFLERLVRRLVTDDKKKFSRRVQALSFEAMDCEPAVEEASAIYLNALFDAADEEVQNLILVVQECMNGDGTLNWSEVRTALGVNDYQLGKRRKKLESLIAEHELCSAQKTTP